MGPAARPAWAITVIVVAFEPGVQVFLRLPLAAAGRLVERHRIKSLLYQLMVPLVDAKRLRRTNYHFETGFFVNHKDK